MNGGQFAINKGFITYKALLQLVIRSIKDPTKHCYYVLLDADGTQGSRTCNSGSGKRKY